MDPLLGVGAALAIVALLVLAYGVWKANPVVSFGTTEEVGAQSAGRTIVYVSAVVLVLTTGALLSRIGVFMAFVVAAPGIACSLLVAVAPQSAFASIALVVLAPVTALTLAMRLLR